MSIYDSVCICVASKRRQRRLFSARNILIFLVIFIYAVANIYVFFLVPTELDLDPSLDDSRPRIKKHGSNLESPIYVEKVEDGVESERETYFPVETVVELTNVESVPTSNKNAPIPPESFSTDERLPSQMTRSLPPIAQSNGDYGDDGAPEPEPSPPSVPHESQQVPQNSRESQRDGDEGPSPLSFSDSLQGLRYSDDSLSDL